MKLKDAYILWTAYFDSTLTRSEGRRIPKELCIPEPTLEELIEAVGAVGLKTLAAKTARFPKTWWRITGYVAVERSGVKGDLMKEISRSLRRNRSARGEGRRGKSER